MAPPDAQASVLMETDFSQMVGLALTPGCQIGYMGWLSSIGVFDHTPSYGCTHSRGVSGCLHGPPHRLWSFDNNVTWWMEKKSANPTLRGSTWTGARRMR
jgi:hypothetical protein